jgi:hypothetical protein
MRPSSDGVCCCCASGRFTFLARASAGMTTIVVMVIAAAMATKHRVVSARIPGVHSKPNGKWLRIANVWRTITRLRISQERLKEQTLIQGNARCRRRRHIVRSVVCEDTNMMTDDWKPSHRDTFQHKRKPKQQQQQQQQPPVESTTDIEDLKRRVERLEEIIRTMLHGNLP